MEAATGVKLMKTFIELWTLRTGKSYEYWSKLIKHKDVYYTAQEALQEGLIDEIISWEPYSSPKASESPLGTKKRKVKAKPIEIIEVSNAILD
jgi:hypothetical protein